MQTKEPVFTFWRLETHYATVQYTLAEIQEMMTGHIVDSERVGEDRLSDAALAQRFADQVNSWTDFGLSNEVACAAESDEVVTKSTDWQWDGEADL